MKRRKMKKKRNKIISKLLFVITWIMVWLVLPTILFLGVDLWLFGKRFDGYTVIHSVVSALGLAVGRLLIDAVQLICTGIKKAWKNYIRPALIIIGGILTGMTESEADNERKD